MFHPKIYKYMKTKKIAFLFTLIFAILTIQNVKAQWKNMTWSVNNLEFKIPESFTIKQNDDKVFTASGGILIVTIKAWEETEYVGSKSINLKAVKEINCTDTVLISCEYNDDQGGLYGYESYYDAKQSGRKMKMIVAGYKDEFSSKNYSVQLLYWDDPASNDKNYSDALEILRSLNLIDKGDDDDWWDY
jgi:hypothetical protein